MRRIAAGAGLGVTAALGASASADGAAFTVNDGGDAGDGTCDTAPNGCTLRDALAAAAANNNPATVDQIFFTSSVTGTITLNGTQLPTIDEPLYIDGPGAGTLRVSAGNASRILTVFSFSTAAGDVTVSGLTLAGGNAPGSGTGGAIYSAGTDLTIRDSTISGNSAADGGAIASRPFKYNSTGGSVEIENSTVSGNSARDDGGGIASSNSIEIENSTISGNSANGSGGGVYSSRVTTIRDSTISGNSAGDGGGGVFTTSGVPRVVNTILANDSPGGVGADLASPNGTFQVAFSLIAYPAGAPISTTVAGSNITGVDPQLGALEDNGGPTRTQALPPGSPAVDAGSSTLSSDQRGMPRPVDQPNPDSSAAGADSADIGAFELQAAPETPIVDTRAPGFELSGDKRQHSKSKVRVDVRCDEACSVDATGTINVPKSKKIKKFDLLEDSVELGAGETATLKLKLEGRAKKLVGKAFKKHKKSTAKVSATAADAAGNVSADDRKVKVEREKKK